MWNEPLGLGAKPDELAGRVRTLELVEDGYRATSRHAVRCVDAGTPGMPLYIWADGGASGIHERSLLVLEDRCFCAVGPYIVALALPELELLWSRRTDDATCFGVYPTLGSTALISHGELLISRLSLAGAIEWQVGGADIFTGPLAITSTFVAAEDFSGRRYTFDLDTGSVPSE